MAEQEKPHTRSYAQAFCETLAAHVRAVADGVWEGPRTRREFLRLCGRTALLGVAALGGLRLLGRRQIVRHGQTCSRRGMCSACGSRTTCRLPQALSRRRALEEAS